MSEIRQAEAMALTTQYVTDLFTMLAGGQQDKFLDHVADDVDWSIMGTHPLAAHYTSKEAFADGAFARINPRLKEGGVAISIRNVIVGGDQAAVELIGKSTQNNGKPFDGTYCWICRFQDETIVEVRAYLDSALVTQVIEDNKGP
jgi:ketosteroid isomerase-like protein